MFEWLNSHLTSLVGRWISLEFSQVRWGIFSLLLAISLFFLVASGMLPIDMSKHPKWGRALFWIGVILAALTIFLGIIWLGSGSYDPMATDLQDIKNKLDTIEKLLEQNTQGK